MYTISITDEQPRYNPNTRGRATSPDNDTVRGLLNRLIINGNNGKISGYPDQKTADAGAKAARRDNGSAKKRGWYVKAATQKEDDGTFSLFICKVSTE